MDEVRIITRLDGGLGNQMFQYAVGRALSLKHGVPLYMDISVYRSYTTRQYALGVFNVAATALPNRNGAGLNSGPFHKAGRMLGNLARKMPQSVISTVNGVIAKRNTKALAAKLPPGFGTPFFEKEQFVFDANLLACRPPLFLSGYWQNERYFADQDEIIRKDFTLNVALSEKARRYLELAERPVSASLHIRRGDYVHSPASGRLNVCGLEYYGNALRHLATSLPGVCVFVFSDEIAWAKANLKFARTVFVEGCHDYEELFLMSRCQHHIIANSSFSWWGAWLNAKKEKIVIAPRRWLNAELGGKTPVPDNWVRI